MALADPDREQQPGVVELGDDGAGRAGAGEHGEQVPDCLADAGVGSRTTLPAGSWTRPTGRVIFSSPPRPLDR